MQYRIEIGNGNLLVFEDDGPDHLKVSVEDSAGKAAGLYLGRCARDDVKRLGKSV